MGIVTTEREQVCAVAPATLYKAMAFDFGKVLPKAMPNFVKRAEIIGDGGPGSVKNLILADGYVKQKVDVVDEENYVYHYTVDEGSVLLETLEKCTITYFTKGDAQLTQEFLKANNETSTAFTKAVVDYLLGNPDYN
ncbi:hypothetical protein VNO78_04658 [Psophocarpus tetragonolobus]|uniref:Bet v I/Major latex protein domain-containing protein n=1 Tax=Psophocarpus tetragonolobus TaxID=3891 RepID=A0AAN9TGC0_PSOTE